MSFMEFRIRPGYYFRTKHLKFSMRNYYSQDKSGHLIGIGITEDNLLRRVADISNCYDCSLAEDFLFSSSPFEL